MTVAVEEHQGYGYDEPAKSECNTLFIEQIGTYQVLSQKDKNDLFFIYYGPTPRRGH